MTDEPTTQPAMTPEQWAALLGDDPGLVYFGGGGDLSRDTDGTLRVGPNGQDAWLTTADRAMVAALCLYGQSFGFTQADVQNLRAMAQEGPFATPERDPDEIMLDIARRIAALLPPASS